MMFKDRVKYIIDTRYGKKAVNFCKATGIDNGTVSNWKKMDEAPKIENATATKIKDIGINPDWLFYNQGEMLILSESQTDSSKPIINGHLKGVPYYSMDVTGSLVRSFSDIQEAPEFYVDFKPLNDCTAYLTVHGDSMFPKYCSGDIVAVKKFNDCNTLLWGEAYMVITDEEANCLRTIKLIHQHPEDDKLILRASNPNYPGDTIISKKNIVNIFIVKGKIKLEQF